MKRAIQLLILVASLAALGGCRTVAEVSGNPADVVGTWNYIVTDPADALNLKQGEIRITSEEGLLSGTISAPHIEIRPLTNVRYTYGELTFRVQDMPGQPGGIGFSLDPGGDTMTGTAFPDSGAGTVEPASRRSGSRLSTSLRLTRTDR